MQQKKPYKTSDYWPWHMQNLNNLGKGLGVVSPTYFVYYFSTKIIKNASHVIINWDNNQQAEMINSTYKSYDDVQGIADTLKSDSNYDNLQSPRKSKKYWSDTNFINSLHDRCKKFYAPVTPS